MPFININGCQLYYDVQGEGVPILFITPPVLTHISFWYQMEELSKYFKVITFDIRGHGRSQFSSEPVTYPLIVEDIKNILNHLDIEKAFICGYSAGGSIALEFLLLQSERALGGIIISGMSEVHDWILKKRINLGIMLARTKALPALTFSISWSNSNTTALFWKTFMEAQKGNTKNIEQYYRYSLSFNCTEQLSKIKHSVLLLFGSEDRGFHDYATLLHNNLLRNELIFIKNGKHQLPTKAAFEINHFIKDFIENQKEQDENEMIPNYMMNLDVNLENLKHV